jgi:hypothetical protein
VHLFGIRQRVRYSMGDVPTVFLNFSAKLQPASSSGARATPEFCKVLAKIAPVDSRAQPINVELNPPAPGTKKLCRWAEGDLTGSW